MSKPKGIKAEVLPAVIEQDEYAERVVNFHVAAGQHASAAVYCAAAAGAVMLQRKKALGWGKGFTKWKENIVLPNGKKICSSTADNYMALAKEMDERIKLWLAKGANSQRVGNLHLLAGQSESNTKVMSYLPTGHSTPMELLAAFDPTKVNDLRQEAIMEAVREVTSEQTLRQLYFAWGIARHPKDKGGYHPNAVLVGRYSTLHKLSPRYDDWPAAVQSEFRKWESEQPDPDKDDRTDLQRMRDCATAAWNQILSDVQEHGFKLKTWEHLEEMDRRGLKRELERLTMMIKGSLNKTR